MKRIIVIFGVLIGLNCSSAPQLPSTATYTISFNATWSSSTHPNHFPTRAHFSKLVAVSHNSDVEFWNLGELSSLGIQNIAEFGANSVFKNEVDQARTLGQADVYLESVELLSLPDSAIITIELDEEYPLLTALSMIAPSPDWFVGVNNINLIQNQEWVSELTLPLLALDAGTDSGVDFTSANNVTNPKQPIQFIDFGSSSLNTFGELVIKRVD
tara:strand:- start:1155 stop:1796 length:642 start_codon:yes stop_codon:yes gene_type:complete